MTMVDELKLAVAKLIGECIFLLKDRGGNKDERVKTELNHKKKTLQVPYRTICKLNPIFILIS